MQSTKLLVASVLGGIAFNCTPALAQDGDFASLMSLSDDALEDELQARFEAGLLLSNDASIISADDPRYLWAIEAKVQCGIALGFMKSSTRDETSIRNCDRASEFMYRVPQEPVAVAVPSPPPRPPRRPEGCNEDTAGIVFFDFDSAEVTGDAGQTLAAVVDNIRNCGWQSIDVVGHADQAGSDEYNVGLSQARADAVAAALRSRGASIAIETSAQGERNPRVPMPDGTRNPQNRRVEIDAE